MFICIIRALLEKGILISHHIRQSIQIRIIIHKTIINITDEEYGNVIGKKKIFFRIDLCMYTNLF